MKRVTIMATLGDLHEACSLVLYVLKYLADLCLNLLAKLHIVGKKLLYSLATLGQLVLSIAEP